MYILKRGGKDYEITDREAASIVKTFSSKSSGVIELKRIGLIFADRLFTLERIKDDEFVFNEQYREKSMETLDEIATTYNTKCDKYASSFYILKQNSVFLIVNPFGNYLFKKGTVKTFIEPEIEEIKSKYFITKEEYYNNQSVYIKPLLTAVQEIETASVQKKLT